MCQYQGHEFGASYPDSVCIDGYLWDADSYDDGSLYDGGELPCPRCNTEAMLRGAHEDAQDGGCGESMWQPWVAMLVWEHAIAKARRENPEAAEAFLRAVEPFETEDWPDRQAVFDGRARWDDTVECEWRYTPPQRQAYRR